MKECTRCKSSALSNKGIIMMINECGHPLCKNCVDSIFARNVAPCHVCGKTLRSNNFWEQLFDDPVIEMENNIRKKLRKIYNLKQDDFPTLREFNDYLERFEMLVMNMSNGIDIMETEAEIEKFREENCDLIEKNRRKLDEDQIWVLKQIKDEQDMKKRLHDVHNQESKEVENSTMKDAKAIIKELQESNEVAEAILDRERKRQIEVELEEKQKAEDRKQRNKELLYSRKRQAESMSFSTSLRMSGRNYEYQPLKLPINGPAVPDIDDLDKLGYLNHVAAPSARRVAGGFTKSVGAIRALMDCRVDLFAV